MFKSIFSKYVSAFMAIVILTFTVAVIITSSVIGRFSSQTKQDMLKTTAYETRDSLNEMLEGDVDIKALVNDRADEVNRVLELILLNTDNITVLIMDGDGETLGRVGDGSVRILDGESISDDIITSLDEEGEYSKFGSGKGRFKHVKGLYAVTLEDGKGSVFVCSESMMLVSLWRVIFRAVIGSLIWVLLAVLIAIYFISDRVIAPLREISSAAKKFAAGKFDVRVPVRGSDEVAELALTFNNMAESLDNYDNMRNSFMSNVSHDLRSPMTSISGFIDGILDGVIPPEQHQYYLQLVSSEIKRLSRLVSSLLDLSRIQAGDRKFVMEPFDVCETSRQILISFEQKIDAKHLDVSFECDEDRMMAIADRDAIHQVIYNLCDNAVKFSEDGGALRIAITRMKGKKLLVEVYNEGQGISDEDINYVFERFYKSDKSRGLNKSGAGLGLFISKTIMDAHEEKIWVESEAGKNCRFQFTLESE